MSVNVFSFFPPLHRAGHKRGSFAGGPAVTGGPCRKAVIMFILKILCLTWVLKKTKAYNCHIDNPKMASTPPPLIKDPRIYKYANRIFISQVQLCTAVFEHWRLSPSTGLAFQTICDVTDPASKRLIPKSTENIYIFIKVKTASTSFCTVTHKHSTVVPRRKSHCRMEQRNECMKMKTTFLFKTRYSPLLNKIAKMHI